MRKSGSCCAACTLPPQLRPDGRGRAGRRLPEYVTEICLPVRRASACIANEPGRMLRLVMYGRHGAASTCLARCPQSRKGLQSGKLAWSCPSGVPCHFRRSACLHPAQRAAHGLPVLAAPKRITPSHHKKMREITGTALPAISRIKPADDSVVSTRIISFPPTKSQAKSPQHVAQKSGLRAKTALSVSPVFCTRTCCSRMQIAQDARQCAGWI